MPRLIGVATGALALITIGTAATLRAQPAADSLLLSVPAANTIRCIPIQASNAPEAGKPVSAYSFHVGRPGFQMRDGSGVTIAAGPSPRIVTVAFHPDGRPTSLSDSVFRAWRNGAVVVQFDLGNKPKAWRQFTTIDSAKAMDIAMKMGPARLLEAATVAEGLRREGPREALDSLWIARARALAAFLWTKTCGPGGKA
jgi:hypothetical protein